MKISQLLKTKTVTISCELFPPKAGSELINTRQIVQEIAAYRPAFMSVTYGASGSRSCNTLQVAQDVLSTGVTALAHLTCVGQTRESLPQSLQAFRDAGVENILALRGDLPEGSDLPQDYPHASDLIQEILRQGDFCIGGACYPEGHPESPNSRADLEGIRAKVNSGCSFLTTQMFFDNNILYSYMFRLLKNGIDVPVIAGIMPVTNARQITRICSLSGTALPPRFRAIVDRFADKPDAMKQAGIAYATEQMIDLIANDVTHIHLYTMNRPDIAGSILTNLSRVID